MDSKDKRTNDLHNLILSVCKGASESAVNEMLQHSMRILNSFIGTGSNEDIGSAKQNTLEKVSKIYPGDSKTLARSQQLLNKFCRSRTLNRKTETLKLLCKLSDFNQNANGSFEAMFKSKVIQGNQNTRLNTTESMMTSTLMTSMARRPLPDQLINIRNKGSLEQNISELEILREITFVMQNISGNLIIQDKDYYALRPALNISEPVRRIVRELCEVGWLFRKVNSRPEDQGTVRDAFSIALKEELNEYYRWIALIENMTKNEELTLRKLVLWSFEPFERLKWMAIVTQAVMPYRGCKIISILNSYRPQGNDQRNDLLNRLLGHTVQPLLKFIYSWIYKGELNDPHGEFFIFDDPAVPMARLWQDKYKMVWDMIPNLIDEQTALTIFNTGKTINFLKKCCNHDYQVELPFVDPKSLIRPGDSNTTFPEEFKHWLQSASEMAHRQLKQVLFNKFKMKTHLDAVKRFLLMGQGEFIHNLMETLSGQLDQPTHQIYKHNLVDSIRSAITSSNTQYLEADIINRVSARLLEGGGDGWDTFSLDYIIDAPLNTLLSPEAMKNYLRIFNLLWKIKRVDHSLNQVWLSHAKETQRVRGKDEQGKFHLSHLLRYAMMHFVTNVFSYIMVTIESAWENFMKDLDRASNFDEVLQMHDKLLVELLDITFLSSRTRSIHTALFSVFQIIYRFKITQDKLLTDYRIHVQRLREYNNHKKAKAKSFLQSDDYPPPIFETDTIKKIPELKQLYHKAFKQFCDLTTKADEKLTFLNFRLDFSEYYELLFVRVIIQLTQKHYNQ